MRIITGRARGVRLSTLEGEATRPTSERAKEAIFSVLQFEIEGRDVLDLFAGSGQMGLEAASRGASRVDLVERGRDACGIVRSNLEKSRLGDRCTLYAEDALSFLRRTDGAGYDIVFLDPPYASTLIDEAITLLFENNLLKPSSLIVCESDRYGILGEKNAQRLETIKTMKHGVAHITIYRPVGTEAE